VLYIYYIIHNVCVCVCVCHQYAGTYIIRCACRSVFVRVRVGAIILRINITYIYIYTYISGVRICVCATRDSIVVPDRETVCRPKLEYIYNRVWLWHFCPPGAYSVPMSCIIIIIILLFYTIRVRTMSYIIMYTILLL